MSDKAFDAKLRRAVELMKQHGHDETADFLALLVEPPELVHVGWEVRFKHGPNAARPGWEPWQRVVPSGNYVGETDDSLVASIREYIARGLAYELRQILTTGGDIPIGQGLRNTIDEQAHLIQSLRGELGESYRVDNSEHLRLELHRQNELLRRWLSVPLASFTDAVVRTLCHETAEAVTKYAAPLCATCNDHGVVGWQTGQTAESFDQGEAPCADCAQPAQAKPVDPKEHAQLVDHLAQAQVRCNHLQSENAAHLVALHRVLKQAGQHVDDDTRDYIEQATTDGLVHGTWKHPDREIVELRHQLARKAQSPFFDFLYRHPDGEQRTVSIHRGDVVEHMQEQLFEALAATFCNCEPAGETNVVDCDCYEAAEHFELVKELPKLRRVDQRDDRVHVEHINNRFMRRD